jgi:hypothetical protein
MLGLLDLKPGFVARATDRPHVWMAGSTTSLLRLHFYTGVVVHRRHGWEIGAPSSFGFLLPTFSWLSFKWVLWRAGRLSCGRAFRATGSVGREEGAAIRVLENGDEEESPSLVLGVREKEREMGLVCWLGLEDERKWGEK